MIRTLSIVALVAIAAIEAGVPSRVRRDDRVEQYCAKHQEHYNKYCQEMSSADRGMHAKLAKFCPAYEKHCSTAKGAAEPMDSEYNLVVPPSLPKGGDFAALDLPIGRSASSSNREQPAVSKTRLTAAIIASCSPDCNAAHCTDECKCAHTHPKVHAMCNPPATSELANTCQRWYEKCPMFQAVQYY